MGDEYEETAHCKILSWEIDGEEDTIILKHERRDCYVKWPFYGLLWNDMGGFIVFELVIGFVLLARMIHVTWPWSF